MFYIFWFESFVIFVLDVDHCFGVCWWVFLLDFGKLTINYNKNV